MDTGQHDIGDVGWGVDGLVPWEFGQRTGIQWQSHWSKLIFDESRLAACCTAALAVAIVTTALTEWLQRDCKGFDRALSQKYIYIYMQVYK